MTGVVGGARARVESVVPTQPAASGSAASWAALGDAVSRTDLVAGAMRRAILDGSLAPGEQLTERDVASRLGVSKTPVRDALKLLRLTGLVEVSSFQRVRVRRIDRALVTELYQARHLIEPISVGLAIEHRGAREDPVARRALADAKAANEAGDMASVSLSNRIFHRELYHDCPNRFLQQELDQLQDLTALSATVGWRKSKSSEREATQHREILDAFEDGDRDRAVRLVALHVEGATKVLLDAIGDDLDDVG